MKKIIKPLYLYLLTSLFCSNLFSQAYHIEDIKIELQRGKCYQASIIVDKSNIIQGDMSGSYLGDVLLDRQASFSVNAYPQGQQPNAYNRLTLVAFSRQGGHQEISLSYNGQTSVFYPNKIVSTRTNYGYHFDLGEKNTSILQELLIKESIKLDFTEKTCGQQPSNYPPTNVIIVQENSTAGCEELHNTMTLLSNSLFTSSFDKDKKASWVSANTKKIYQLPNGCTGRSQELNKLFDIAKSVYSGNFDSDKRRSWFNSMLDYSFKSNCSFQQRNLGSKMDEVVNEAGQIFDWHEDEKKRAWITKEIKEILDN